MSLKFFFHYFLGNKYKDSGVVFIKSCQIETQPTFVEYLQGGVSMNFSVAVDFTASNGDPRQPQSLHFFDPNRGGKNYHFRVSTFVIQLNLMFCLISFLPKIMIIN